MAFKNYGSKRTSDINCKVIEKHGKLSNNEGKMNKELRVVSWNDGEPKYDIRPWQENEDGTERCGKGITFTAEELAALFDILKNIDEENAEESAEEICEE